MPIAVLGCQVTLSSAVLSTSMHMMNICGDRGPPWLMPRDGRKRPVGSLLIIIKKETVVINSIIHFIQVS